MRSARMIAAVILVFTLAMPRFIVGGERYQQARDAELIVVDTLHPSLAYPWFDGFHMGGTITVKEVLFGDSPGPRLQLREVWRCSWSGEVRCDIRALLANPRFYPDFMSQPGIWCLRRADGANWRAAGIQGFDALDERAGYEEYIRRYKR